MKILIADDEPVSRRLLQGTLVKLGHEVVAVADGLAAVAALVRADAPSLAILDWMMPGLDGPAVCRMLRERAGPYVYTILLTARDGHEDMVAGLDAGADDFLTKPVDANELRSRLRSGERVVELQAGLLEAQETLREQATRDGLTGLWNRRMILEELERQLQRTTRDGTPLAVAIADVDHFKSVNDTYGHAAGDSVLREVAARLGSSVRAYDLVGRYGGEEFLLVLPGCDAARATHVVDRIREFVAAEPVQVDGTTVQVSVSIGVASTPEIGRGNASALIAAADRALYRAKALGRNRVERMAA